MSIEFWAVLAIFSVYRLAILFAIDYGPLDIFLHLRAASGRKAASGSTLWKSVAELLHCPYCLGVWFAALIGAGFWFYNGQPWYRVIILIFGIAGAQAFLQGLSPERGEE